MEGWIDTPGTTREIVVSGSYAYIGAWDDGLKIVDCGAPTFPRLVGAVATDRIEGLVVAGNFVYTAGLRGLKVIDVSSPEAPEVVASFGDYRSEPSASMSGRGVSVVGNYAYVAANGSLGRSGLVVIDITTPAAPQRVGSVAIPGVYMEDVDVSAGYAYVAAGRSGLYIFDISNPSAPEFVTMVDTPGYLKEVLATQGYVYAVERAGLLIIDTSSPRSPDFVGFLDTPDYAIDVVPGNGYLIVVDRDSGLLIVDVTAPETPAVIKSIKVTEAAIGMALTNDHLLVTNGLGLQLLRRDCALVNSESRR